MSSSSCVTPGFVAVSDADGSVQPRSLRIRAAAVPRLAGGPGETRLRGRAGRAAGPRHLGPARRCAGLPRACGWPPRALRRPWSRTRVWCVRAWPPAGPPWGRSAKATTRGPTPACWARPSRARSRRPASSSRPCATTPPGVRSCSRGASWCGWSSRASRPARGRSGVPADAAPGRARPHQGGRGPARDQRSRPLQGVLRKRVPRAGARRAGQRRLRLSRRGAAVPFHVEPARALFAPGSFLYFVGRGRPEPERRRGLRARAGPGGHPDGRGRPRPPPGPTRPPTRPRGPSRRTTSTRPRCSTLPTSGCGSCWSLP